MSSVCLCFESKLLTNSFVPAEACSSLFLCVVKYNLCYFKILSSSRRFLLYSSTITMSSNFDSAKVQPATCTFVIDNFSKCTIYIKESDNFNLPSGSDTFVLCMNPDIDLNSTTYWESKNVSFSLFNEKNKFTVLYRMSIVNSKGQKCNTQEGKINFTGEHQFGGQYILSRKELLDTAKGWLVNDTLTVYCEVYRIDSDLDVNTVPDESVKQSTLLRDYGSLFESGKLSDLVLVAGGTEFKVHKTVLGARSAVFGAMFEHDTKEKQENRIEIKDVLAETYNELLRYIYTDKVDNLKENALELMAAADKYQLDHLKSICEQYLGANLTIESVAITLVMADLHRAEALKAKCIEYISKNGRKVKATEGWSTLFGKPELLTELFLHVSDKYNED